MIQNELTVNFDQTWDPITTNQPLVNEAAQSDGLMGKHFQNWLRERKGRDDDNATRPFFAQMYYFDSHYPFFVDEEVTRNESLSRVDGMLRTVDKNIDDIFTYLKENDNFDNTIIIGSGDHGEYMSKKDKFVRIGRWSEEIILHPLTYMHVPMKIQKQHPAIAEHLKHNMKQLVSILDIYPTIRNIMEINNETSVYSGTDGHCVRGYDLTTTKLRSDRIAWSFPGVASDFSKYKKKGLMAIHYGTDSSLYFRFGWPRYNGLNVLKYKDAIRSANDTKTNKGPGLSMGEWRSLVDNLNSTDSYPVVAIERAYMTRLHKQLNETVEVE